MDTEDSIIQQQFQQQIENNLRNMVDKLVGTEENAKRIANVENCFGVNGVPLQNPDRVLVGEGVLNKLCRKKLKPRQIFLFNDILVYGSIIIKKKKYARQHIIPLSNVKIEDYPEKEGKIKNAWLIRSPTKSFMLYAASEIEKREWINHINMCIKHELDKRNSNSNIEHAAPWLPDNLSNQCMHCKKTQFTVINRRHHCRKCGLIVCGTCSKNNYLLTNISSKPVRVCDKCFDELQIRDRMANNDFGFGQQNDDLTSTNDQSSNHDNDNGNNIQHQNSNDSSDSDSNLNIMDFKPTFYSHSTTAPKY
uniref:Pleckstrin homology domain-containing family F member 2-like isoform X2 n=1 Tax=Dermatophagoides pteronyssinus TaxID=6956 RepID=A0A6P6Y2U7_DERPT|nr:pleckstrin homology domain-containing family F member 2-like isoform X2 [Dermatophagoides pteronyssinus]